MSKIEWDTTGQKFFEAGVDHCVLYRLNNSVYSPGVAWNGITSISESPEGGDENAFYADNIKYGTLRGTEDFGGSIEAYTYPDAWAECDGSAELTPGATVSQQVRKTFGLCYRSLIGNDEKGLEYGYRLHLVYGATASPSEKSRETINDSPDASTMSWDFTTTPVNVGTVNGVSLKPTSHIIIDSTKFTGQDASKLTALENALYGTEADPGNNKKATIAHLPLPADVVTILTTGEDPNPVEED